MAICRVHKKKRDFSIIANQGANDPALSYKARGILWHLLSKPDDWEVKMSELENASDHDGREGVRSGFKELIEHNYAFRVRGQHPVTKRIIWVTEVFETKEDCFEWKMAHGIPCEESEPTKPTPEKIDFETLQRTDPHVLKRINGNDWSSPIDGKAVNGFAPYGTPGVLLNTDQLNTERLNTRSLDHSAQQAGRVSSGAEFQTEKPHIEQPSLLGLPEDRTPPPTPSPKSKLTTEQLDTEFAEEFWPLAIKKVAKGQARKKYRQMRRKGFSKEAIVGGFKLANQQWADAIASGGDKQFVPYPSTWLEGERWEELQRPPEEPETGGAPVSGLTVHEEFELYRRIEADRGTTVTLHQEIEGLKGNTILAYRVNGTIIRRFISGSLLELHPAETIYRYRASDTCN